MQKMTQTYFAQTSRPDFAWGVFYLQLLERVKSLLEYGLWHVVTQPGFGSCVVPTLQCTLYHSSTLDAYERRDGATGC